MGADTFCRGGVFPPETHLLGYAERGQPVYDIPQGMQRAVGARAG